MGVEVIGQVGEIDGYGDSMDAFRKGHEQNTAILLNLAEGKKKNDYRPPFNPSLADNAWPVMLYHPEKGERVFGVSLVGLTGTARREAEKENVETLEGAKSLGYRAEPYRKPQIVVLDPAVEKAALLKENQEMKGTIVSLSDQLNKLQQAVEKLMSKGGKNVS